MDIQLINKEFDSQAYVQEVHHQPQYAVELLNRYSQLTLLEMFTCLFIPVSATAGASLTVTGSSGWSKLDGVDNNATLQNHQLVNGIIQMVGALIFSYQELMADIKRGASARHLNDQKMLDFAKKRAVIEVNFQQKINLDTSQEENATEELNVAVSKLYNEYFHEYYLGLLDKVISGELTLPLDEPFALNINPDQSFIKRVKLMGQSYDQYDAASDSINRQNAQILDREIKEYASHFSSIIDFFKKPLEISDTENEAQPFLVEPTKKDILQVFGQHLNNDLNELYCSEFDDEYWINYKRSWYIAIDHDMSGLPMTNLSLRAIQGSRIVGDTIAKTNVAINVPEGWASFGVAVLFLSACIGVGIVLHPIAIWIGISVFALLQVIPAYTNNYRFIVDSSHDVAYDLINKDIILEKRNKMRIALAFFASLFAATGIFTILYLGLTVGLTLMPFIMPMWLITALALTAGFCAFSAVITKSSKRIYQANPKLDDLNNMVTQIKSKQLVGAFLLSLGVVLGVSTLVGIPLFAGVASFPILILTLTCLNYNILTNVHSQTKAIDWKTAINDFLLSLNTFTILLGVACAVIILGPTLGLPLPVAFVLATIIGLSYGLYQYSNQKCVMNADDDLKLKSYVEYTNSLEIRNPITNQTDSNSLFHSQNYENSLSQVERMQEQPQDENVRSSRVQ